MERVGTLGIGGDPAARYDELGRAARAAIERALPRDLDLRHARVLDLGCGSGRVMRQFSAEVDQGMELTGSEIDPASVAWVEAMLCPPFAVIEHEEAPPLDLPDGHFDLIYAMSVFSHITEHWAAWALELHRLLRPGGVLIATFLSSELFGPITGEPWVESRIGHLSAKAGNSWDAGGPVAFASEWWLRAHWGRAFEVISFDPTGWPEADPRGAQAVAALRRDDRSATRSELEAPDPGDPREIDALRYASEVLWRDSAATRVRLDRRIRSLEEELPHVEAQAQHWRATAETWERLHDEARGLDQLVADNRGTDA